MEVIYRVGWIALIGSSVLAAARANPKTALRNGAIWLVIFLGVVGLYAFKNDAAFIGQRIMGALSPTQGVAHDDGTLSFDAGPDGHFRIQAVVNGGRVTFMVDTGATDVVLAPDDARRIGIDPATLVFDQVAETANGTGERRRHPPRQPGHRVDRDEPAARDGQRRRHVGKPAGHGVPQSAPWLGRRERRADAGSLKPIR